MADVAPGTAASITKRISALAGYDTRSAATGKVKALVVGKEISRRKTEHSTQL